MTNQITDLDKVEQVRLAPVIFQENVCKEYEVRSTVVGRRVFSIKIESQQRDATRIDWRHDFVNVPYSEAHLPESIERKCLEMVRLLGLEYGAIDFIKTPQDKYVFLEINPLGQYQWIEHATGIPISKAIARLLAGLEPSLVNRE